MASYFISLSRRWRLLERGWKASIHNSAVQSMMYNVFTVRINHSYIIIKKILPPRHRALFGCQFGDLPMLVTSISYCNSTFELCRYSLTTGSGIYYRKLFVREFVLFVSRLLPGDHRYVTVTVVFYNTLIFATTTTVRVRLSTVELATLRNDAYIPLIKNCRSSSIRYREYIWQLFTGIIFPAVSAIPPNHLICLHHIHLLAGPGDRAV